MIKLILLFLLIAITFSSTYGEKTESVQQNDSIRDFESVVSILAGFATAGALVFVGYETMMHRRESRQKLRAWLSQSNVSIDTVRVRNANGQALTKHEWESSSPTQKQQFKPTFFDFALAIENFGELPATNVMARFAFSDEPSFDELIVGFDKNKQSEIMPHQSYEYIIDVPYRIIEDIEIKNMKYYFIFEVSYNTMGSKKEHRYSFISEFSRGMMTRRIVRRK